jgi:ribosomal protein S27AE
MHNSKTCPKCNSTEIIHVPGSVGAYGVGANIATGRTVFSRVKVSRYVCGRCGFIEEWVDELSDLEKIKQKYQT